MWAKSESLQNAGHQMAGALTPPRRRKPEKNRVLRCQLLLCAAAVLGMLLLQRLRPESAGNTGVPCAAARSVPV